MNNNESGTSGIVIGILVIVVIAIVAWIAYTQGFFKAKEQTQDTSGSSGAVQINLGGSSDTSGTSNTK